MVLQLVAEAAFHPVHGRFREAAPMIADAFRPCASAAAEYLADGLVPWQRPFHHLKGPLAVTPMFLKNPERMADLACILVWALTAMALQVLPTFHAASCKLPPLWRTTPDSVANPVLHPFAVNSQLTACLIDS